MTDRPHLFGPNFSSGAAARTCGSLHAADWLSAHCMRRTGPAQAHHMRRRLQLARVLQQKLHVTGAVQRLSRTNQSCRFLLAGISSRLS